MGWKDKELEVTDAMLMASAPVLVRAGLDERAAKDIASEILFVAMKVRWEKGQEEQRAIDEWWEQHKPSPQTIRKALMECKVLRGKAVA